MQSQGTQQPIRKLSMTISGQSAMRLTRRRILKMGLGCGLSAVLFMSGCRRRPPADVPNIIFILIDALRADHLPCYGYGVGTAPNLGRLAKEGMLFRRVIAPSSWTKTSMASILTSSNPSHTGVKRVNDALPRRPTTLAKMLMKNGYRTVGVNTNPWLLASFGFDSGFHIYSSLYEPGGFFGAWRVNREAATLLQKQSRALPVFLYLHYMDVHSPYTPERMYFSKPPIDVPGLGVIPDNKLELMYRTEGLQGPDVQQRIIELYDGGIRMVDAAIAELLNQLKRMGRLENAIVVITSDHGEAFREHGTTEHGKNLYPEVYEVPLILHWPGHLPPGTRINAQVRSIDIAPTLLSLIGADIPASFKGTTLPLAAGNGEDRIAISEVGLNGFIPELDYAAVISAEYLYVHERRNDTVEFYDLRADPGAQHNLGRLHLKVASYAMLEETEQAGSKTRQVELDKHTQEMLKSLGYLK
jgi:arylsulfatase A-like enzyme